MRTHSGTPSVRSVDSSLPGVLAGECLSETGGAPELAAPGAVAASSAAAGEA